jgi:hypothetical protein
VSPEAEAVLHFEIGQILRHFSVYLDYTASSAGTYRRYAVWDGRRSPSVKVTEPNSHAGAIADRTRLQTEAILQLIKELAPDDRAAD